MPLDINGYNKTFSNFASFAEQLGKKGLQSSVINADSRRAIAGPRIVSVESSVTDHVRNGFRTDDDKAINDRTRQLFRDAVADMFGGESKIPANVIKAMELSNYGNGKPLTARRILFVKAEVDKVASHFNVKLAEAKAAAVESYGKVNEDMPGVQPENLVTKWTVDLLVSAAMECARGDKEALDLLVSPGMLDGLLIRGDSNLRTPKDVRKKVGELLANIDELRKSAKGNAEILKAGFAFLKDMNGKTVPPGMIAKIVSCALNAKVNLIKGLDASSSGLAVHKALLQFKTNVVAVLEEAGVENALIGTDERVNARNFIASTFIALCGKSAIRKIMAALNSENTAKLSALYARFSAGKFGKTGLSDGVVEQTMTMAGRAKGMLLDFKIAVATLDDAAKDTDSVLVDYEGSFDKEAFHASEMLGDLVDEARVAAREASAKYIQKSVKGDAPGADAYRRMFAKVVGAEAGDVEQDIIFAKSASTSAMLNWSVAADCRLFAQGKGRQTAFAAALAGGFLDVNLPGGAKLSTDYDTALDQVADLVTNGKVKSYRELGDKERNKVHIALSLLSKETEKAAFDGQATGIDPNRAKPAFTTVSRQDEDTRSFTLDIDKYGRLSIDFDGTKQLDSITTEGDDGNPVTTAVNKGSNLRARMSIVMTSREFDRMSELDFTKFDDSQANALKANAKGPVSPEDALKTFDKSFRFDELALKFSFGLTPTFV